MPGPYVVLNRADFYSFCAALAQFPDWEKLQAWVMANEVTAPDDLPTVEDTVTANVTLLDVAAKLDTLQEAVAQLAVIGQVFEQFGAMVMGAGPASPYINAPGAANPVPVPTGPTGYTPAINMLSRQS